MILFLCRLGLLEVRVCCHITLHIRSGSSHTLLREVSLESSQILYCLSPWISVLKYIRPPCNTRKETHSGLIKDSQVVGVVNGWTCLKSTACRPLSRKMLPAYDSSLKRRNLRQYPAFISGRGEELRRGRGGTVSYPLSWRGFETDISRIRALSITSSTNLLIYIRPFFWEIMNVCVILWILCVRLCYSLTFYIILQVFVLLSVCLLMLFSEYLFYLLTVCVIIWMFCYSLSVCVILFSFCCSLNVSFILWALVLLSD